MDKIIDSLSRFLGENMSFTVETEERVITLFLLVGLALVCYFSYWVTNKFVLNIVHRIVMKTKNQYDDVLLERRVFNKLAQITPALIIKVALPYLVNDLATFLSQLANTWIIAVVLLTLFAFLDALNDIYQHSRLSRNRSIKGYVQLLKVILVIIALFALMDVFIEGFQMSKVFAGLGAMAAVLILVFRDTILSLVASIQIGANDMVRLGDWIVLPKYNADGEVIEISLNTIKIQNWDKTISTIPIYALVSDSFQNWRGMDESGGRRIKRSLNIDMKSVRFVDDAMLDKLKKFYLLNDYIEQKESELQQRNEKLGVDDSLILNASRQTNLGIFRKYLESYLHSLPTIHDDMTFLVRHLQPTEKGLPIEIYVFSNRQEWAVYESIQADIFDHVLAIIHEFDLRVFQNPTGDDFAGLGA